jgi:hypothetical protein
MDRDERPLVKGKGDCLGVRPNIDIHPLRGQVFPVTGGMSVAPDEPANLPNHRRPKDLGGTAKHPAWAIQESDLPDGLRYRTDPLNQEHGFIEPLRSMPFESYEELLESTRDLWIRVA